MVLDLLCTLSLFGGFFYLVFGRMKRFRKEHNAALRSLATHYGFGFNEQHGWNGTAMSGMIGNYRCRIWFETVRRRSRRNRSQTYMHATITLNNPRQLGLEISPQGFLSEGIRLPDSMTGNQDITIGHPEFDGKYRIKGYDENAVRAFLTPEKVQAILQLQNGLGPLQRLSITDQEVAVRFPGLMADMQMVGNSTSSLAWLAQQIDA